MDDSLPVRRVYRLSVRYPEKQEYTWWSYRFNSRAKNKGWRIDYCMVSEPVRSLLKEAVILNNAVHFRPLSDGIGSWLNYSRNGDTQFASVFWAVTELT